MLPRDSPGFKHLHLKFSISNGIYGRAFVFGVPRGPTQLFLPDGKADGDGPLSRPNGSLFVSDAIRNFSQSLTVASLPD